MQVNKAFHFLEEPKMQTNSTGQRAQRELQTTPQTVQGLDSLDLSSILSLASVPANDCLDDRGVGTR